jgi:membrane protease YdiL (CAAX protease family)
VTVPEPIRAVDPRRKSLVLFIAAHFAIAALVNLVFFAADTFRPLASATGGLFTGSLLVNLLLIAALIWLVIGRIGGLRPYDVGLNLRKIPMGIVYALMLWVAAQGIHLVLGFLHWGQVTIHPAWVVNGSTFVLGLLIAQLLGNALFEEIAYRGFLFPQMFLRFKSLTEYPQSQITVAILVSQVLFALSHIPNRIYLGMSAEEIIFDLLMLLGWGILYTLIYIRTDNLFIVVGIHALGNTPTTLFATAPFLEGSGGSMLIYALAFFALFALPRWKSRWLPLAQVPTAHPALADNGDDADANEFEYGDQLAYALAYDGAWQDNGWHAEYSDVYEYPDDVVEWVSPDEWHDDESEYD